MAISGSLSKRSLKFHSYRTLRVKPLGVAADRALAVSSRWTVLGSTLVTLTGAAHAATSRMQVACANSVDWLLIVLEMGLRLSGRVVLGHAVRIHASLARCLTSL